MAMATDTPGTDAAPSHTHAAGEPCCVAFPSLQPTTGAPPAFDAKLHEENRHRLAAALRDAGAPAGSVVLLQGGQTENRHETDHEPLFRQESYFVWAFGVRDPDFYGTIDVDTGRAVLYAPDFKPEYAVWMGPIKTTAQWKEIYGVDEARIVTGLVEGLGKPSKLFVLQGLNTDSGKHAKPATFDGQEKFDDVRDVTTLHPIISELRVFKTARELALLKFIASVSSEAHLAVVAHTRPGMREYQLESVFRHWCYYHGGARFMSYTCICASGSHGAVLHYGHAGEPNAGKIPENGMCLFDMGAEYEGYGSDITTSFPANGKFSEDQKLIYTAVLSAQHAVMGAMRPGVNYRDMQELSYRTMLTVLRDGGLLVGSVDEMMAVNLGATFQSHGLGHFLGIDTHDVGGYPEGTKRPELPGYRSLRTTRPLAPNMYLTVEPGCYFNDMLLEQALADENRARFINKEMLARFRGFGGVRIEDDVVVTETGIENYSHAPRSIEDIEAVAAGRITKRSQLTKYF